MNKQVEANLSMIVSKALGGFNMNALKYLLPLWIGSGHRSNIPPGIWGGSILAYRYFL